MATSITTFLFLSCMSLFCSYVLGNGQFMIAHLPEYLSVNSDTGAIDASEIPDLFSLALGFSSSKPLSWHGMSNGNIFRRPKAGILITVEELEGSDALKPSTLKSIPIKQVKPGSLNLDSLKDNIRHVYGRGKPVAVELSAGVQFVQPPSDYPALFEGLPPLRLDMMLPLLKGPRSVALDLSPAALNLTHLSDISFFSELQIMHEVMLKLKENEVVARDNIPDIYAFELSGYRALQTEYGPDSAQVIDAQNLLASFIQKWGREMIDLYDGDVFMGVATVPMEAFLHRQGRSLMEAPTDGPIPPPPGDIKSVVNVAPYYDDTFPIFFNIFLWLGIILVVAVYAVASMLGNMDPGDSIIYRMTSQRIKID